MFISIYILINKLLVCFCMCIGKRIVKLQEKWKVGVEYHKS